MAIDKKFWNGKLWDSHAAFATVGHQHLSCYSPIDGRKNCDLALVECQDGRWYVEDSWGDARGEALAWDPYDPTGLEPHFFGTESEARAAANAVVLAVSGIDMSVDDDEN